EEPAPANGGTSGLSTGGATGGGSMANGGAGASTGGNSVGSGGTAPGAGGDSIASGGAGTGGSTTVGGLPCDVLSASGHTCVAAHSTVRALVSGYTGNLYRLERSGGETLDVSVVDGHADADAQNAFCGGYICTISVIYDQSGHENDLTPSPPGGANPEPGKPAFAANVPLTIQGRSVFGVLIRSGMGYRKLVGNGMPVGDEPQTIYMVTSQRDLVNACCFDYGNAETTANDDGNGAAEAVNFSGGAIWGTGVGSGPWVMADLENGLFPGWENGQDRNISTNTSLAYDFVTAVLVGDTWEKNSGKGRFALYGGDAAHGALNTMYDGVRPTMPGYVPMVKQGSVILGISGDNSANGGGRFYEGVIANGAATKETVDALQTAIVAAGYGK
ncbi:MAG TPA: arabinofuranosidase catalytic domain-containing protein, partial [Polyangiaceae bacterium]